MSGLLYPGSVLPSSVPSTTGLLATTQGLLSTTPPKLHTTGHYSNNRSHCEQAPISNGATTLNNNVKIHVTSDTPTETAIRNGLGSDHNDSSNHNRYLSKDISNKTNQQAILSTLTPEQIRCLQDNGVDLTTLGLSPNSPNAKQENSSNSVSQQYSNTNISQELNRGVGLGSNSGIEAHLNNISSSLAGTSLVTPSTNYFDLISSASSFDQQSQQQQHNSTIFSSPTSMSPPSVQYPGSILSPLIAFFCFLVEFLSLL